MKDASLLAKDFKSGQLPAGPRGEQGPRGDSGATGATGPAGPTFSFALRDDGTTVPVSPFGTNVVSRTITIPRAGRLNVNFSGRFSIASLGVPLSDGDAAQAFCFAATPPGPVQRSSIQPSSQATYRPPSQSTAAQITLTFGYLVPAAGDYTFEVTCSNFSLVGTPDLDFGAYDMTGVLTGS